MAEVVPRGQEMTAWQPENLVEDHLENLVLGYFWAISGDSCNNWHVVRLVKQQQQLGRNSGEVRHVVTSIGLDS